MQCKLVEFRKIDHNIRIILLHKKHASLWPDDNLDFFKVTKVKKTSHE